MPSLTSQAALKRSGIVPVTDLAKFKAPKQPLLLLDERTGQAPDDLGREPTPTRSRRRAAT
ncbi:MAG: hypothetical protein U0R70_13340 [Solirubrobacteraceae bacterium]